MSKVDLRDEIIRTDKKMIVPLYPGEFGWELMTWIPWLRKQSRDYDRVFVTCRPSLRYLYDDFATKILLSPKGSRGLDYPKMYRVDGEYRNYGRKPRTEYDLVIHARGISRKSSINYRHWPDVLEAIGSGLNICTVGSRSDLSIPGVSDERGVDMRELCSILGGAGVLAGVSSGVMHLGALCGAPMIVWGDNRTYFGETLETRYKQTWNPFGVEVSWIEDNQWQPDPLDIATEIEGALL